MGDGCVDTALCGRSNQSGDSGVSCSIERIWFQVFIENPESDIPVRVFTLHSRPRLVSQSAWSQRAACRDQLGVAGGGTGAALAQNIHYNRRK